MNRKLLTYGPVVLLALLCAAAFATGVLTRYPVLEAPVHLIPYLRIVGGHDFRHILAMRVQKSGHPGPAALPGPFCQIQQLGRQFRIPAGLEIP